MFKNFTIYADEAKCKQLRHTEIRLYKRLYAKYIFRPQIIYKRNCISLETVFQLTRTSPAKG